MNDVNFLATDGIRTAELSIFPEPEQIQNCSYSSAWPKHCDGEFITPVIL